VIIEQLVVGKFAKDQTAAHWKKKPGMSLKDSLQNVAMGNTGRRNP
jgi:hypothetical protein